MPTYFVAPQRYPLLAAFHEKHDAGLWPTRAEALASREQLAKPLPPRTKAAEHAAEDKTGAEAHRAAESLRAELKVQHAKLDRMQSELDELTAKKNYAKYKNSLGTEGLAQFAAKLTFATPGCPATGLGAAATATGSAASIAKAAASLRAANEGVPADLQNSLGGVNGLSRFAAGIKVPSPASK